MYCRIGIEAYGTTVLVQSRYLQKCLYHFDFQEGHGSSGCKGMNLTDDDIVQLQVLWQSP